MRSKPSQMKSKTTLRGVAIAAILQFGALAGSAQADIFLYTGSETNVTLDPGTYIITAYGAQGGWYENAVTTGGGGAEMSAEFNFAATTSLTLLVGGRGDTAATVASGNGG